MNAALLALAVSVAGGLGAAVRYLIDTSVPDRLRSRFPWGIAIINLTGSLALGVLTGFALTGLPLDHPLGAVASIGFLGGYTTFSTASLDTVQLLRKRRYVAAIANGPGMLVASVALAMLGIWAVRG